MLLMRYRDRIPEEQFRRRRAELVAEMGADSILDKAKINIGVKITPPPDVPELTTCTGRTVFRQGYCQHCKVPIFGDEPDGVQTICHHCKETLSGV